MKIRFNHQALNLYCKQTGLTLVQIAEKTGLAYATVNRYARGERIPDIENLLKICNALHLRINEFITHPDIEPTNVHILHPEEWTDIAFRHDRIEAIRLNAQLTKTALIQQINQHGGCNITRLTYNQLISGAYNGTEAVLGLIASQDVDTDYLFEQPQLQEKEDGILIPRSVLTEMEARIARLESDYRELQLKNKRLEKRALPRYQERMANKDADKIIRTFVRNVEKAYAELKSWLEDEEERVPGSAACKPYGETIDRTLMVADARLKGDDSNVLV